MSDIIERAQAVLAHRGKHIGHGLLRDLVAALKAARAQLEYQRIDTVERLREFQPRPDLLGGVLIKSLGHPSFGGVYELNDDGTWNDFDSEGKRGNVAPEDVPLPAYVLWIPEAK